ncbi:MAG: hypothetical protein ACOX9C_05260 [Kiritimatiellia bacterium]|jgi:hypothetical protein
MKIKRKAFVLIGAGVIAVCVFIMVALNLNESLSHYSSFKSPSGQYEIVVLAKNSRNIFFPGQSGDRPGLVLLKTSQGETIGEATVDMVQLVDSPIWEDDRVFVKFAFEFELE